ncbi:3-ketoacyl-CoA synthase 11 [Hordeum vulgare]|nr:3-ketoacyl-CoA synthase 11 [Hordeum vulgare]
MDSCVGTSSQYTNPDIKMSSPVVDDSVIPDVEMGSDQQVERTTRAWYTSHTDRTSSITTATQKSNQKARGPNKLYEGKIAITTVGPSGEPVTPDGAAERARAVQDPDSKEFLLPTHQLRSREENLRKVKQEFGPGPHESPHGYTYDDPLTRAVNMGFEVNRKPKTRRAL